MTHTKHHGAGDDRCEDEAGEIPLEKDELPLAHYGLETARRASSLERRPPLHPGDQQISVQHRRSVTRETEHTALAIDNNNAPHCADDRTANCTTIPRMAGIVKNSTIARMDLTAARI
jgi:hypothetical protein